MIIKSPPFTSEAGTPWKTDRSSASLKREFDVLLTIDGSLEFQQNLSKFQIGVIVAHVPKNQLAHYWVIQKELLRAVVNAAPGEMIHVWTPAAPERGR